jgi:hypothetical protein
MNSLKVTTPLSFTSNESNTNEANALGSPNGKKC